MTFPCKHRHNEVTILGAVWFSDTVGIVLTKNAHGVIKSFIKNLSHTTDQQSDAEHVADWGNTFPLNAAYELFPQFKSEKK